MPAQRLELHQPPFAVLRVHAEGRPHKHRGGDDTETDADPLADACHVHDDEHHEQGEQTSGENKQVLALESLELRAAPDPLVYRILRHTIGRTSEGLSRPRLKKYTRQTSWRRSSRCPDRRTRTWNTPLRPR